eukprot:gene16653-22904_t
MFCVPYYRRIRCQRPARRARQVARPAKPMDSNPRLSPRIPLRCLNHVSRVCRSVETSATFYRDVLGFNVIKRPQSFEFDGAWLYGYNLGIHLIKGEPRTRQGPIDPRSDHLSFQSDSLDEVEGRLRSAGIPFVRQTVFEDGLQVQQIFFHDPDGAMLEVCNCDVLPIEFLELQATVQACLPCQAVAQAAIITQQKQEQQQEQQINCAVQPMDFFELQSTPQACLPCQAAPQSAFITQQEQEYQSKKNDPMSTSSSMRRSCSYSSDLSSSGAEHLPASVLWSVLV